MTIHFHQDSLNGKPLINLFKSYLDIFINHFKLDVSLIEFDYRTDQHTYVESVHDYTNTNILLSFSQCAGLDPELPAGELIVPDTFVPYNIDNKTIDISKSYQVPNDIVKSIGSILKSRFCNHVVNYMNDNYKSYNTNKKLSKISLSGKDFHINKILQVDKLWNPIDKTEMVNLNK
jgi:hypothetical protein